MKEFLNYKGYLSKLSKKDLELLLAKLKDYKIKYRDSLGIHPSISFGTELEFEHVLLYMVEKEFSKHPAYSSWIVQKDDSCSIRKDGYIIGGEVSSAILHDRKIDWKTLAEVLSSLIKLHAKATERTSLHVHVGSQIFAQDIQNVARFVKVWCIFEHVIFRFSYGKSSTFRPRIREFALPIADTTKLKCKYFPLFLENLIRPKDLNYDRKWALNFRNCYLSGKEQDRNTIEIRIANGSLEGNVIQNTINFYLKLMLYVMSDRYDKEFINQLFQRLEPKDLVDYDKIIMEDALLLVDLIFEQSIDKINFLRQYVKQDADLTR